MKISQNMKLKISEYSPGAPSALTQIVHYLCSYYTVFHSVIYNSVTAPHREAHSFPVIFITRLLSGNEYI